jgi:transposase-like protein
MTGAASKAETFWTAFLRTLAPRGLRGVKLVVSDAHGGLKAAVAKVLHPSWQRCGGRAAARPEPVFNRLQSWAAIVI